MRTSSFALVAVLCAGACSPAPRSYVPADPACNVEALTGPTTRFEGDGPAWVEDARGDTLATFARWGDAVLFVDALCAGDF